MEVELILVALVVVVGVILLPMLRGSRPDSTPIVAASSSAKRSPKKAEPRRNTEKWDADEKPAPRGESPGKKAKKPFDPVKAGEQMVRGPKQTEVRRREPVQELTEEEQVKRDEQRRQQESQGFVVVDEKKKKKTKEAAEEGESPKTKEKTANELALEKLQALRDNFTKKKPADGKATTGVLNAKPRTMEEVEKLVEDEKKKTVSVTKSISTFKVVKGQGGSKLAHWAPKKEEKPVEEEAAQADEPEPVPETEEAEPETEEADYGEEE